jgi:hypothetical protein
MDQTVMRKLSFVLCSTTIATFVASRVFLQLEPYWAGRRNYGAFAQRYALGEMMLLGVVLCIGVFTTIGLAGLLIYRLVPGRISQRKTLWETLAMAAATVATIYLCLGTLRPGNQYFLSGFRAFINEHAALPEIRQWSLSLKPQEQPIAETEWPQVVSDLSPEVVSINSIDGDRELSFTWGGGFMHWGLTLHCKPVHPGPNPGHNDLKIDERSYVWVDSQ